MYTCKFSFNLYFEFLVGNSNCKPYIIVTSAFKLHYCKVRVICALKWSRREIHNLLSALSSLSTSGCGPEQLPQSVCQPRCGAGAARDAPQETRLCHFQQWGRPVPEIPARHTRSADFFLLAVECLYDRINSRLNFYPGISVCDTLSIDETKFLQILVKVFSVLNDYEICRFCHCQLTLIQIISLICHFIPWSISLDTCAVCFDMNIWSINTYQLGINRKTDLDILNSWLLFLVFFPLFNLSVLFIIEVYFLQ